jgi:vancomycin permeability regulator SanA
MGRIRPIRNAPTPPASTMSTASPPPSRLKRRIRRYLALLLLWPALHTVYVVADGLRDEIASADCILVLGNTVLPSGQPAPRTQARLDRALQLYRMGHAARIMVSGGTGVEGQPEGSRMADYLIAQGVPADHLLIDDHGDNTRLTAEHFAAEARNRSWTRVLVVSQFFHITRCRLLLHQAGVQHVLSAHADYFEWRDVYSTLREFPAFYASLW